MNARWVAATTRARALSRRRVGPDRLRALASSSSLSEALGQLAGSAYLHNLAGTPDIDHSRRSVTATAIWHLRVLAGWLPPGGTGTLRALAGWYEVLNIEHRLATLAGTPGEPRPYELGSLATSWNRMATATSATELRRRLTASAWGDPGSTVPEEAAVGLRMSWAERLDAEVPQAAEWAAGRAAILAAVSVCSGRQLPAPAAKGAERLLGRRWRDARSLADLAGALPRSAAWPLAAIADPQDLWRSEARWWGRLAEDGLLMARTPRPGPGPVVGAAASLMADAWQLGAALEVALRGGREPDHVLG